jgi:hypothetical protein
MFGLLDIPFKNPFGYVLGGFSFHGFRGSFGTFALHFETPFYARLTVVFDGLLKTVMIANGHGQGDCIFQGKIAETSPCVIEVCFWCKILSQGEKEQLKR